MVKSFQNTATYQKLRGGVPSTTPLPRCTTERGRKVHEGKRLEGEKGETRSLVLAPPPPPPVSSVYNLTRSPLTPALYYLNAWNRLTE